MLPVVLALVPDETASPSQAQADRPDPKGGLRDQSAHSRHDDAHRRAFITPHNVASLVPIGTLDKDDIWRVKWSPARGLMALVSWKANSIIYKYNIVF